MTTFTFTNATADSAAALYAAADRAEKARIRADYASFRDAFVRDLATGKADAADLPRVLAIGDALTTEKAAAEPTDYAQVMADHVATLRACLDRADAGDVSWVTMPEGVDAAAITGWESKVGAVGDVSAFGRISGRKGMRGSVGDFVDSVLGDEPMTVAQLRGAWVAGSFADYPKAAPSAGAITAWLTRDNEKSVAAREALGIEATDLGGVLGATRS